MRIAAIITLVFFTSAVTVTAKISPRQLTCEYLNDPQVIDITNKYENNSISTERSELNEVNHVWFHTTLN